MPGHKGPAFFTRLGYGRAGMAEAADFDITEIPGADDLRHADGVIKAISDRYSELYGSRRSFISVNGSSAPIMAAVMSQVGRGRRIIASSDCHISVKNGIRLAGAEAVYVEPERISFDSQAGETAAAPCQISDGEKHGIPGGVSAEKIGALLDEYEDADAVIFPSPNYFGVMSDVAAIAEEVHRRGKVLIVDQAHGAHLKMFSDAYRTEKNCGTDRLLPAPAEECGADIVIDSTHKTMASFTQSAVVNIFGDRVDADEYEQALLTLESTSPSYILMYSLAVNAEIMAEHGNELAKKWRDDLDHFYSEIKKIDGVRVLTGQMVPGGLFDDTKIVLDLSRTGMSGKQAEAALIERGIYPEFSTGNIVMCLTGIGNVRADYDLLLDAARELWSAEK